MITPFEKLDILLKADFDAGDCLWIRKEGQEFTSAIQDVITGCGISLDTQKDLYRWFLDGKEAFKSGTIKWHDFEKRGEDLSRTIISKTRQRFRMWYGKSPQYSGESTDTYREIVEELKEGHLSDSRVMKATICFSYPESGWVQLVILADFKHHIIWLSDVFDPFLDMERWLLGITEGRSETLHIDEEGYYSYITVRTLEDTRIELIVESDHTTDDSDDLPYTTTHIVSVLDRRQFVDELYWKLIVFMENEYSKFSRSGYEYQETNAMRSIRHYLAKGNFDKSMRSLLKKYTCNDTYSFDDPRILVSWADIYNENIDSFLDELLKFVSKSHLYQLSETIVPSIMKLLEEYETCEGMYRVYEDDFEDFIKDIFVLLTSSEGNDGNSGEIIRLQEVQADYQVLDEEQAVTMLNNILAGNYGWNFQQIGVVLDQVVAILEPLGLMEKHDALLNLAADYNTVALFKECGRDGEKMEKQVKGQIEQMKELKGISK